ncbi:MAG: class I SAM-dependent methyltransferase [Anaerolineae bacterium]|nr:class I SAM-dependent methyltransferase [Anaerolineae bacterium]
MSSQTGEPSQDFLEAYLAEAPAALALLRAVECRELNDYEFEPPILDLGCGNGLMASILREGCVESVDAGLDLAWDALSLAKGRGIYRIVTCADLTHMPFGNRIFGTVLSNSVLEHVPDLAQGLREVARVLAPSGRLIFTVPTERSSQALSGAAILRGLGLRALAVRYAAAYDRAFGQVHLYDVPTWRELLEESGLRLVEHRRYAPARMLRLHDLLMPLSLSGYLSRRLMGRWIWYHRWRRHVLVPAMAALLRGVYESTRNACSLLMVAMLQD